MKYVMLLHFYTKILHVHMIECKLRSFTVNISLIALDKHSL